MATANTIWQIAFGDYDFAIDRKALTYRLTETKTGTVWADGLPVGWLELEERATGTRTRYDFGSMRLVSLSEKAGVQGKRILFGLDCQGIPVDLYFTCSQKEIQLTVEASRDTRTHDVQDVCLLPGLVSVPGDGVSYLVIPHREGAMVQATAPPAVSAALPIWDADNGVTMPFVGAVRCADRAHAVSALALITDSAYGVFHLERSAEAGAFVETRYTRDPERRRLDIRVIVLPEQNHVAIARAYRDKLVGDKNHVTLRRKAREHPALESLLGGALIHLWNATSPVEPQLAARLHEIGVDRSVCVLADTPPSASVASPFKELEGVDAIELAGITTRLDATSAPSRWDIMDQRLQSLADAQGRFGIVGSDFGADWSAIACHYWRRYFDEIGAGPLGSGYTPLPLYATVYHDAVIAYPSNHPDPTHPEEFLRSLLSVSPPLLYLDCTAENRTDWAAQERAYAVLAPLHRLCFPAFLTEHRFLTPDYLVEEARYSNGAYVLVNQSETDAYENEQFLIPPLGFYAEHAQMIAYDALRVGGQTFETRAFRIRRSRDEKPLAESAYILSQEFLL